MSVIVSWSARLWGLRGFVDRSEGGQYLCHAILFFLLHLVFYRSLEVHIDLASRLFGEAQCFPSCLHSLPDD